MGIRTREGSDIVDTCAVTCGRKSACLAPGFVEDDGSGSGDIEGAGAGILHGNFQRIVGMIVQEGLGQSTGLRAEHQEVTLVE